MRKVLLTVSLIAAFFLLTAAQTPNTIEVKDALPFAYVSQSFSGSYQQMAGAIGGYMGEFFKQGLAPQGALMGVYHNDPRHTPEAELKWEIAFVVAQDAVAKEPLFKKTFAGSKAIHYLHVGPYSQLPAVYAKIHEYMEKEGYQAVWPSFDSYLNNPQSVKPEELQTLIMFPVTKK